MLRIEGLVKRYDRGAPALDGVDLAVARGELVALIGPSGAGKSTLLRCVNRLVEPTEGRVFLEDVEVRRLRPAELRKARRRIGMVFQEFALVERLTVMENVQSGRLGYLGFWRSVLRKFPDADLARAAAWLRRLELVGLDDARADSLSGGQRQRVGIARALMQEPSVLLADEPTASLDPRTSREILRLLVEIVRERELAAVISLHDVSLAKRFAGRIVGLRAGRVVYDGPAEGLDAPGLTTIYGEEDWRDAS